MTLMSVEIKIAGGESPPAIFGCRSRRNGVAGYSANESGQSLSLALDINPRHLGSHALNKGRLEGSDLISQVSLVMRRQLLERRANVLVRGFDHVLETNGPVRV